MLKCKVIKEACTRAKHKQINMESARILAKKEERK